MTNENIGNRTVTVKEILENLLGQQKATNVLAKIQAEFDNPKGVRGVDLKDLVRSTIKEETGSNIEPGRDAIVVAITVEGVFSGGVA